MAGQHQPPTWRRRCLCVCVWGDDAQSLQHHDAERPEVGVKSTNVTGCRVKGFPQVVSESEALGWLTTSCCCCPLAHVLLARTVDRLEGASICTSAFGMLGDRNRPGSFARSRPPACRRNCAQASPLAWSTDYHDVLGVLLLRT